MGGKLRLKSGYIRELDLNLVRILLVAVGLTLVSCGSDAPPPVADVPAVTTVAVKPQPIPDLPEVNSSNVGQVRELATSGDAAAQYRLGFYLRTAKPLTEASLTEGLVWIRQAAQQAFPDAERFLGTLYLSGECREETPDDADSSDRFSKQDLEQWLCEEGGFMKPGASATTIPEDINEAIRWFQLAAEHGHSSAQWTLGYFYATGKGVPEDDAIALTWYQRAAEFDANFQSSLSYEYRTGKDIPKNNFEAMGWLLKAAQQGGARHQFEVGRAYDVGDIVTTNKSEAVKWYRLAAEQGNAAAQNNLGTMYEDGDGITKDEREAVKWYRLAAEQGYSTAQGNLGRMYGDGKGVPENDVEAVKWYRLAAEQGEASAQSQLGWAYLSGRGVSEDNEKSYFWYALAAAAGLAGAAENRDVARGELTKAQIRRAQALAATWTPAADFAEAQRRVDPSPHANSELEVKKGKPWDGDFASNPKSKSEMPSVSYPQGLSASRPEVETTEERDTDIAVTTVGARLREAPEGDVLMSVDAGTELALLSREPQAGWYEVVDIESGTLGWIHRSVVRLELAASPAPPAQIFEAQATGIDAPPEVKVENRSDRTIWLRVDGQTHAISSKQTLALSVGAGDKSYTAWAPGVIPAVGIESFKRGYSYGWAFWIETRSGIGIGRRRKR